MPASAYSVSAAQESSRIDRAARALLYITPLAVAFGDNLTLSAKGLRASPTDFIAAALAALGGYSLWRIRETTGLDPLRSLRLARRDRPEAVALLAALLAYLLVIMLSVVVAYTRVPVIKETLKWGETFVIVCAAWAFLRTERQVMWMAWGAIIGGVAEAILGAAQYVLGIGLFGAGGAFVRVVGTFGQPNPYGGYLNLSLPIALSLALFARDVRMRWVAVGSSALLLFGIYLSDSRGAFLGLAAAMITIIALGWRLERKVAWGIVVAVPLLAIAWVTHLIPASIQERLLSQFRLTDVSLSAQVNNANYSTIERLAHWVAGIRMFEAHPILGVGAGNYSAAYAQYKVRGWDAPLTHAHNYYINAAAETGILGLLAFLAVACAAFYLCWRGIRITDVTRGGRGALASIDGRALGIGFVAVVVALCIHNLTDDLFVHAMELQFGLVLGLLLRLATPGRAQLLRLGVSPSAPGATTELPTPNAS